MTQSLLYAMGVVSGGMGVPRANFKELLLCYIKFCSIRVHHALMWITYYPVHCQGLPGLPPASMVEILAETYKDNISLQYRQQQLFPSLKFSFNGRITGWTIAAIDNEGCGHANLSVWSVNDDIPEAHLQLRLQ